MGLVVSWERWDAGSIPSPAQWVKDPALPQLQLRSQLRLGSDPWPGNSICCRATKKGGKKSFLICKTQLYGCQRYQGGRRLQLGFRSKRCWLSFGEEGLSQGSLPAEGRLALLRGSGAQLPPELRFPDL